MMNNSSGIIYNNNIDPDVFSRYGVINNDWKLCTKSYDDDIMKWKWGMSLGVKMMALCMDVGGVSDSVKSEVNKFNNIYDYYFRHLMVGNAFISYPSNANMTNRARHHIFKSYNIDPWNRQFPYFIDNEVSDYYNNLNYYGDNRMRYGYWVFYRDMVISCNANYNHISHALLDNVPPLMILTTTSLDGITVGCLDFVEG